MSEAKKETSRQVNKNLTQLTSLVPFATQKPVNNANSIIRIEHTIFITNMMQNSDYTAK